MNTSKLWKKLRFRILTVYLRLKSRLKSSDDGQDSFPECDFRDVRDVLVLREKLSRMGTKLDIYENRISRKRDFKHELYFIRDFLENLCDERLKLNQLKIIGDGLLPSAVVDIHIEFDPGSDYTFSLDKSGDRVVYLKLAGYYNREAERQNISKRFHLIEYKESYLGQIKTEGYDRPQDQQKGKIRRRIWWGETEEIPTFCNHEFRSKSGTLLVKTDFEVL